MAGQVRAAETTRIVVVGAGQAGAAMVQRLRLRGHVGPLTLIGAEPAPPYQRPPLSKAYLKGEMTRERLFLRPRSQYAEAGISLRTGVRVAAIDRAARAVVLESGERVPYDRLALTTGAVARRLPAATGGALGNVLSMRDLGDADALAARMRPGARAVIVGGGYIGLEAAAVLAGAGLAVTLIEAAPRILGRVAAAETADYFRALHTAHGVVIREDVTLADLEGVGGEVVAARLADGTRIGADLVLVGIGVRPADDLAWAAGLETADGIVVDGAGRTSDAAIFAAGDCARFPHAGRLIRLESVPHAIEHAEAVAEALLDHPVDYVARPWFWSDQYDVKLQIAGLHAGYTRTILRPGARPGAQSVWYLAGARLVAVDAMNDPRAYMTAKRWIEAGISPDPAGLMDPGTDLKALA